ncbi:hypothetical protein NE865_05942 [Phthorimaea operculella]|nr:hypothetical protein NE865_05942 [Phthorimaea operculella]
MQSCGFPCGSLGLRDNFTTYKNMYLTIFSNTMILLGYAFRKISLEDLDQSYAANSFILFGHLASMISDAYSVMEDLYYMSHCKHVNVNGYHALANVFTAIAEYHDLRSSLLFSTDDD